MDNQQIAELKAVAEAATPGPWMRGDFGGIYPARGGGVLASGSLNGTWCGDHHATEKFIAAANPAAVLELIAIALRATEAKPSASAAPGIERLDWLSSTGSMEVSSDGTYVTYDDHVAAIAAAREEVRGELEAAHSRALTRTEMEARNAGYAEAEADLRARLAAPEPVKLEVWYGPMPESNGKSNFTATLKRKSASMFDTDSYTFQQSEYPDRVRYEADCMRYLIGDLAERPDILDYDADKRSGYIAPQPQAKAPQQPPAGEDAAARDVLAERRRQVEVEGWTPEQDDEYSDGQLSMAAAMYAMQGDTPNLGAPSDWPWDAKWWKPSTDRRNLVKAAALILADIERIDRASK